MFFAPAYSCPVRLAVPRVTTVHDLSFFSWPADFSRREAALRRWAVAASVGVSERAVAVSEFTRRELEAQFPRLAGRVRVIAHGTDDDLPAAPPRDAARARLGLDGPLVLSVGSLFNRRRAPVLLEALRRVVHPSAVLECVGDNRTLPRLDLSDLAARLGIAGRFRFPGFVDEAGLADRYAAADVFVYLSEYEGFGLPVLEAMARGVPVVTSVRPATGEIFAGAAILVDPSDSSAVAAAIERVLTNRLLREDLVARGRALAARHSWSEAARATRAVLDEAAGR